MSATRSCCLVPRTVLLVFTLLMSAQQLAIPAFVTAANEDSDLDLIPEELMKQPPSAPAEGQSTADAGAKPAAQEASETYRLKVFVNEAFQNNFKSGPLLVPTPTQDFTRWNNRTSLDARAEVTFSPALSLTFADRLNYFFYEGVDPSEDEFQNDLKEIYLTGNISDSYFLDLGRVNVREGAATGFNPTDYFKKNAVTTRISDDPGILRENRLGAVMARGQGVWEKGALTLVAAPEVPHDPNRWWTSTTGGLGLDRTNDCNRFLAKTNLIGFWEVNPELLYYYEEGRSNWGLNLTKGIGDRTVVYGEWSIGQRKDVISEALQDAKKEGIIPFKAPPVIPGNNEARFYNQLAVGFSYTEKVNRTTYFEYHYNEAAFSEADWDNWFHAGAVARGLLDNTATEPTGRGMLSQLWYMRQWAQNEQEPLTQHMVFVRSKWEEAFVKKLDLTGIFQISLLDGSFFLQPLAEYHLSDTLTLALTLSFYVGDDRSQYGSLTQWGSSKLEAIYYF